MVWSVINNRNVRLIIFDLDGCLYPRQLGFNNECCNAAAKAVAEMSGIDPNNEAEIIRLSKEIDGVFFENGEFYSAYTTGKPQLDIEELHRRYHTYITNDNTPPCQKTIEAMNSYNKGDVLFACLTHGSRQWAAEKCLPHIGLRHHFDNNLIIPLEEVGFSYKDSSPAPFEYVLQKIKRIYGLNILPSEAIMVEDSYSNLKIPHQIGMGTIGVHHGEEKEPLEHVHAQISNISFLLNELNYKMEILKRHIFNDFDL